MSETFNSGRQRMPAPTYPNLDNSELHRRVKSFKKDSLYNMDRAQLQRFMARCEYLYDLDLNALRFKWDLMVLMENIREAINS